jgi:hypothetical protein
MAKRLFLRAFSNSIRQCTPHVRRYYSLNKPHDFHHRFSHPSFSPTNKASFSSSSNSNSKKVGFVGWYLRKLENHPIITKSITSSLIFTAADLTSQVINHSHLWL